MFECGISVVFGQMTTQIENGIVTAVQRVGIDVDKERLEQVLFDARGNYERGFREGYEQAMLDKEQETVKPILKRKGRNKAYNDYVCPVCDQEIAYQQNYCSECGKPILWEGGEQDA